MLTSSAVSTRLGLLGVFLIAAFCTSWNDVLFVSADIVSNRTGPRDCPCKDASLCKVIQATGRKEVYGFGLKTDSNHYLKYDWTKLTTLAMWDFTDELVCFAHEKGVRVDLVVTDFPKENLTNVEMRKQWIEKKLAIVKNQFLDGINFDPEYPIALNSAERQAQVDLVNETKIALAREVPGSKVSFDAAWASFCVDDRCYDYKGLSEAADFLFIMSYDIQGQIWGPDCIAMSNTPLDKMIDGMKGYLALGIPPSRLVLGLAWYGYDYPCVSLSKTDICEIPKATYHGAPCSDLVGAQKQFDEILLLLENSTTGRRWNLDGEAPQFNYKDADGKIRQVHYDDPESLLLKYLWAVSTDLLGVGFWNINCLTDMETPEKSALRTKMWNLVPDSKSWSTYLTNNGQNSSIIRNHLQ